MSPSKTHVKLHEIDLSPTPMPSQTGQQLPKPSNSPNATGKPSKDVPRTGEVAGFQIQASALLLAAGGILVITRKRKK